MKKNALNNLAIYGFVAAAALVPAFASAQALSDTPYTDPNAAGPSIYFDANSPTLLSPNDPTQLPNSPVPTTQTAGNTGSVSSKSGVFTISNPLSDRFNSVGGIIEGFVKIFSYLVVIMAVLALVWVGFQMILAQGRPERLSELKNWLLYIVIGVAIVIGAPIIINVVINTLEASGTVNPAVIQSAKKAANGQ